MRLRGELGSSIQIPAVLLTSRFVISIIPEGPQMRVFGCLSAFSSLCAISRAPFGTGRNYPSWKNSPRARSRWFRYGLGGLENGNNAHPSIHPRVGVNQKTKRGEENHERRRRRRLLSITPARTGAGEERQYLFHLSFSSPSLGPAINDSIKIVCFLSPSAPSSAFHASYQYCLLFNLAIFNPPMPQMSSVNCPFLLGSLLSSSTDSPRAESGNGGIRPFAVVTTTIIIIIFAAIKIKEIFQAPFRRIPWKKWSTRLDSPRRSKRWRKKSGDLMKLTTLCLVLPTNFAQPGDNLLTEFFMDP